MRDMNEEHKKQLADVGLLLLRVIPSLMLILRHGADKLWHFGDKADTFADPLHIGSGLSLSLAVVGEFFMPVLVLIGFGTRFAAVPSAITMGVAAFLVHAHDPLAKKELAILYLVPYLTLILMGGGRFAVDQLIQAKKK